MDVTAAFVEIRLRDPFFRYDVFLQRLNLFLAVEFGWCYICHKVFVLSPRNGLAGDDALESEEMLAMLYSMAIMR